MRTHSPVPAEAEAGLADADFVGTWSGRASGDSEHYGMVVVFTTEAAYFGGPSSIQSRVHREMDTDGCGWLGAGFHRDHRRGRARQMYPRDEGRGSARRRFAVLRGHGDAGMGGVSDPGDADAYRPMDSEPHAKRPPERSPRAGPFRSGDRIRTCDLWVMSYAPSMLRCSCHPESAGEVTPIVPIVALSRTGSGWFCGALFPNLFPSCRRRLKIDPLAARWLLVNVATLTDI